MLEMSSLQHTSHNINKTKFSIRGANPLYVNTSQPGGLTHTFYFLLTVSSSALQKVFTYLYDPRWAYPYLTFNPVFMNASGNHSHAVLFSEKPSICFQSAV